MNQGIKNLWVAALQSGAYKQGANQLCTVRDGERRHCCLGVLTDLAVSAGVIEPGRECGEEVYYKDGEAVTGYNGEVIHQPENSTTLPEKVREWAGLEEMNPKVEGHRLSEWNDGWYDYPDDAPTTHTQKDFDQIAGLIARNL